VNRLDHKGAELLCEALKANSALTELDLSGHKQVVIEKK